jgi:predicted adenylyl cyclase CyaB
MSYEVEIKARIEAKQIEGLKKKFSSLQGTQILGDVRKEDTYFAVHEADHQLFRVRLQSIGGVEDVLVTSKPLRTYEGTEINKELEFHGKASESDTIKEFFKSLGYVVCLTKLKTGWSCVTPKNDFEVIVEIFKVDVIGYFLEMEITSIQSCETPEDDAMISKAQKALVALLEDVGISERSIETKSYRSMILEARAES